MKMNGGPCNNENPMVFLNLDDEKYFYAFLTQIKNLNLVVENLNF